MPMEKISLSTTLYKSAGVCEIEDIITTSNKFNDNIVLIAKIIESYEPVEVKFKVEKYDPPVIKKVLTTKDFISNISGKILRLTGEHRFAGAGYMCITDLGKSDKVKLGDILDIVRIKKGPGFSLPNKLGEAQIVHISENFSTAFILTGDLEMTTDDLVTLSKIAIY